MMFILNCFLPVLCVCPFPYVRNNNFKNPMRDKWISGNLDECCITVDETDQIVLDMSLTTVMLMNKHWGTFFCSRQFYF